MLDGVDCIQLAEEKAECGQHEAVGGAVPADVSDGVELVG